jgi:uncharacterized membrane protein YebE (DUF533 family)
MFNAEQLLGKMMAGMVGGGGGAVRSLTSTMLSGQGLMTAIGLGVGAYEILKSQQGATPPPPYPQVPPPTSPSGYGAPSVAATPAGPPPVPGSLVGSGQGQKDSSAPGEELALRLIQVMIAAAYADGRMDSDEEGKILVRLQGQGLGQEERRFILAEMHAPKSIEQLAAGINDPRVAQTMYSLAVSTVVVDSPEERAWLDRLATALSISEGMRRFIEAEE